MSEPADPYAPPPPAIWQVHKEPVTAIVVAVVTVLLAVASFPPFHAPEFAYAMLAPGILWAYRRPRFKVYAWTMFAAQAVAWTILLGWLHHVTWFGLLLLGPFVGAWVGSWYLAAWWAMPRLMGRPVPVRLLAMLGLAGLWVVIEWSRGWLLGGFPWLPLAASQWERVSILQIASYTGSGGVSFVIVAMGIGFSAYGHRLFLEGGTGLAKRSQEFFLATFLLLGCLCVHVVETANRGQFRVPLARIGIVQPYIPQTVKWNPAEGPEIMRVLATLTLQVAGSHPDLILWPESSTPWAVKADPDVRSVTEDLAKRAGAPLILGSFGAEPNGREITYSNGAFVVDPVTRLRPESYAKRKLVPFGEFVPLRPVLGWLKKFVEIGDVDFTPGVSSEPLNVTMLNKSIAVAPLICYEDIFPGLARSSVLSGADLFVVLTNNAWYGEGGAAYQHAAHSVLRAVETRRPVVRVGNGGWSGWIDEFGNVRSVLTQGEDGVISIHAEDKGTIYFRGAAVVSAERDDRWIGRESVYVQRGDWFVLVCAGLVAFGWLLLRPLAPRVAEDLVVS